MKALFTACAVCCICTSVLAGPAINVGDLQPGRVVGRLGKPLGTRTTIEGQYETCLMSNPLAVTEIDGKEAATNILISIRGPLSIRQGVTYRLEGYESGEFGSSPAWLAPKVQQPFQFYSFFVVTAVMEPKKP